MVKQKNQLNMKNLVKQKTQLNEKNQLNGKMVKLKGPLKQKNG